MKGRAWIAAGSLALALHLGAGISHGAGWKAMNSGPGSITGIWGASGSDVFAVSGSGWVLRYNGSSWIPMNSDPMPALYGVWGASSSDVHAVGSGGAILHYDGSAWTSVFSGTTKTLRGIWGASPTDVFAVGAGGAIQHFDGSAWTAMNAGGPYELMEVWGTSGSDVFAVGYEDFGFATFGVILHYDGSTWARMSVAGVTSIAGVWGASPADVYAVGAGGKILHFDGVAWTAMPSGTTSSLYAVWGASGRDVYATCYGGILHYDGSRWAQVAAVDAGYLSTIWGTASSDVLAAGSSGILRYDGSAWVVDFHSPNLSKIWGSSGSDLFAVGSRGTILRYKGGAWTAMATGSTAFLHGIWGSSSQDVFAVGGGGTILHYNGSAWKSMASGTTRTLLGVWGTASNDVFAVGDGGTILHYNGSGWAATSSGTTEDLQGIWGTAGRVAFAAGYRARIQRFDGTKWYTFASALPDCPNYDWAFNAVWGASSTDVFFVGDEGRIWHYTGTALSSMESNGTGNQIEGVWGSSARDIYAVGPYDILHYDGTRWTAMPLPENLQGYLRGVWGASPAEVFAVGSNQTVLRYSTTNDAPTGIALSPFHVAEQQPAGTTVGSLKARDPDTGDTFTYALVGGAGSADNVSFRISGNQLKTGASFDYDVKRSYSIRVKATDQGGLSTEKPFAVTVIRINDAPAFLRGPDQELLEDGGPQTVSGWATGISPGPADEAGQAVDFVVTNSNNALFSAQPAIAADGTLSYTPAANASGTALVTARIHDTGGTDFGGSDTSAAQTFTISILPVNDQPSFTKGSDVTVPEDSRATTVYSWARGITAGPGESSQRLAFTLTNDNNGLFAAQPALWPSGALTFTAAAQASGTALVSVQLSDDGGTANGGADRSAVQTFTITVLAVNDAPSFTKGPDQEVLEAAGAQLVAGWATGISPGPPDEAGQSVDFIVTNDNSGLFAVEPGVAADGTLSYTPARHGRATVTVRAHDSGGTANGGLDTSPAQVFAITVTRLNSAPSFIKGRDQETRENSGPRTVPRWATGISAGPPDDSWQTVDFVVTNDNNALFQLQPGISPDGTLRYAPAAHADGTATVTVQLHDNGGTAFGGVDTSEPQTFRIVVRNILSVCPLACDFSDLQEALDAAAPGDIVLLAPGVWRVNLAVSNPKEFTLLGGGNTPGATTLQGGPPAPGPGEESSVIALSAGDGARTRIRIENVTLAEGSAPCGGGLRLEALGSGDLQVGLSRVVVRRNRSGGGTGGGICARATAGGSLALDLENVMVTANGATEGGGIYAAADGDGSALRLEMRNDTIGGNQGDIGSGVRLAAANGGFVAAAMVNTILAGNSAGLGEDLSLEQSGSGTVTVDASHSLVGAVSDPSGTWTPGEGMVTGSPVFRNPAGGDFHLHADSPCLNRGTQAGAPAVDFEGNTRLSGTACDIGADEYAATTYVKLKLLSPPGGATLPGGRQYDVTWGAPKAMTLFRIYASSNAGATWRYLGSSRERHFTWRVPSPGLSGARYRVRVVGYSSSSLPLGAATSGLFGIDE